MSFSDLSLQELLELRSCWPKHVRKRLRFLVLWTLQNIDFQSPTTISRGDHSMFIYFLGMASWTSLRLNIWLFLILNRRNSNHSFHCCFSSSILIRKASQHCSQENLGSGKFRDILGGSIWKEAKILLYKGRGKLFQVVEIVGSGLWLWKKI